MSEDDTRPTVLVVDDDPEIADLYANWLESEFDVQPVYSGEAALEALADEPRDVVLLDRRMPDLSGDKVLVTLRDWGIDARVAMVTAKRPQTDIVNLGFDDYLLKPVDRTTLVDTVHRISSRQSFDTVARELSSLRVKRNVLETELRQKQLATDEQYNAIVDRIEKLEETEATYRTQTNDASRKQTQRTERNLTLA